jgi:hypothetical protein
MTPREPTKSPRVACKVCGKTMRLTRTVAAPARNECYEFWECVACGHTHLRATSMVPKAG